MAPSTRYVDSGGVSIAYQVVGEGPFDMILVPGYISNIEMAWGWPEVATWLKRLASFSRLILFDKRGTGLSDPVPGVPTLEERMEDVHAVLDAVGSERAALFGVSEGGPMSALFSATYPDRVRALVLYGSFARGSEFLDAPYRGWGADPDADVTNRDKMEEVFGAWGEGLSVEMFAPELSDDPVYRRGFGLFERMGASPGMARAIIGSISEIDVSAILGSVSVPTLVLHRVGDAVAPIGSGRRLAAAIPGAELAELPGDLHVPFLGDVETLTRRAESFLTGAPSSGPVERALATVLFTDIVGSTEHAARLGDARWREVLARHDEIVRAQTQAAGGRVVKSTGDGFLLSFDGPARAIRTATAIRDRLAELDLPIRAGIHTGECEIVGDDVAGIAIHIGSRVAAAAVEGEILVTSAVKDLVVGSGLEFVDRGEHELKGVPGAWRLLEVAGARTPELPGGPEAAERVVKRGDRLTQALTRHAPGIGRTALRMKARRRDRAASG